jgi:3-methyladenine DNA glycosylase/8-oxoguanine DNA glycosylase
MLAAEYTEAIGSAVLAVNSWTLDRVWNHINQLRKAGLFDPTRMAGFTLADVIKRLSENGYDRGNLTWMIAERLQKVIAEISKGTVNGLPLVIKSGDRESAIELLKKLPGVGPTVANNALLLLL